LNQELAYWSAPFFYFRFVFTLQGVEKAMAAFALGGGSAVWCYCYQANIDGVAKSPLYGVTAFFQHLDILDLCLESLKKHQAL
jgi:hypothetical protein